MPRFARNDRVLRTEYNKSLFTGNLLQNFRAIFIFIPCNALYVFASENTGTPRDTVYSRGKGVCKHKTTDCCLRQSVGQKRSIRRGGKGAHKQKSEHYRPDNAISKVQCAPWGNDNTTATAVVLSFDVFRIKELWIVICVNFGERGDFRPVRRSTARRLPLSYRSLKNLQEGFRPHTDCTCRWLRVRALTGLSPAPVF